MEHKHSLLLAVLFLLGTASYAIDEPKKIVAPVSAGELMDKITILHIKTERIIDEKKRKNAAYELTSLKDALDESSMISPDLEPQVDTLTQQLLEVNKKLWDIEDAIRAKESKKEYDEEFIALARSVYINNRERHRIKRKINETTGSAIIEEKQYTEF